MSEDLRIGLLSFAHDHAHHWARAIVRMPGVTLAGIWDEDPARGASAARTYGAPFFHKLDALLGNGVVGVGICAENSKHADLVVRTAEAGIHVLCEKPMALTIADCDRMIAACAANGVAYVQAFPQRLDPAGQKARALVRSGALGRIAMLRKRHGHFYGLTAWASAPAGAWFRDRRLAGGGALLDEGIHAADFVRWLLGDPVSVSAMVVTSLMETAVDDNAVAIFRFASGALAVIETSWTFQAGLTTTEIYGERGSVLQFHSDGASARVVGETSRPLWVFNADEAPAWHVPDLPISFGRYHERVAESFVSVLRGETEPPATGADGREALRMILAAYRSSEEAREIAVEEVIA